MQVDDGQRSLKHPNGDMQMAKATGTEKGFGKEDQTKKLGGEKTARKKSGRPAKAATRVAQAAVAHSP